MENQSALETLYLDAKLAYYEGNPIMGDSEFDAIEKILKESNSFVIKQVGTKRKDMDFPHFSPMLSLSKIQTEEISKGVIDRKIKEFNEWFLKRVKLLGIRDYHKIILEWMPKYDGNAFNCIYKNNKLQKILSRSDALYGKDVTEKLRNRVEEKAPIKMKDGDTLEVRGEGVIKKETFETKYASKYANPRNMVAGIVGRDDKSIDTNDIDFLPVHYILNGVQVEGPKKHAIYAHYDHYENMIKDWEVSRDKFNYQIDGIVISFPIEYRSELGLNEHDPEFSLAIKFVPEAAVTTITNVEWNVGKTGELCPVGIVEPAQLAGTIVKRSSCYNMGFVIDNSIGIGAIVTISKHGDIIPSIDNVILPAKKIVIPTHCPICNSLLIQDECHLICDNDSCAGKIKKRFISGFKKLKLKGVGPAALEKFVEDFDNIIDVIVWIRTNGNNESLIESYGFKYGSRSHEIFLNVFMNIKTLTYAQVIVLMGYDNVGLKMAVQAANYINAAPYDFAGHERACLDMLISKDVVNLLEQKISDLSACGVTVERPKLITIGDKNSNKVICELTGSPKSAGYKTKEEFLERFSELEADSLSNKNCEYLICDDYNSSSSKMTKAKKKNVKIITYSDYTKLNK